MIDYGRQISAVKPLEIELTESKVFIASNIVPVIFSADWPETDEQPPFEGFEFDLIEYSKDEYIKIQAERNTALENEVTATQMALCEVYELIF